MGAIALFLLSALLVLPGGKMVRHSYADWHPSHPAEGGSASSNPPIPHRDEVDNLRLPDSSDTLVADTDYTVKEDSTTTSQDRTRLPVCEKTVLFRFAGESALGRPMCVCSCANPACVTGLHGFGSEVTLLYRVAAIATHFGYQVFLDDEKWNYGAWSDYFLDLDLGIDAGVTSPGHDHAPLQPSSARRCRPPKAGTKRAKLVLTADEVRALTAPTASSTTAPANFVPRWATRPHVVWFSRDMDALDLTYLRLFSNATELEHLHAADLAHRQHARDHDEPSPLFLPPEETLPPAFESAFEVMSRVAGRAWRVNDEIEREVATLAERVGLDARNAPLTETPDVGQLLIAVHVR